MIATTDLAQVQSLPVKFGNLHQKTNLFLNCNVLDSNQYTIPAFIVSAVILFLYFFFVT